MRTKLILETLTVETFEMSGDPAGSVSAQSFTSFVTTTGGHDFCAVECR
jgi:hypothetical protein